MRPILFDPENVRKILCGTKTMTRRVIEPQPEFPKLDSVREACPYGLPSDVPKHPNLMWVQEKWCGGRTWPNNSLRYYVDCCKYNDGTFELHPEYKDLYRWQPAVNMPYWASRIFLEILDVRVERLRKIVEEDAIQEGVADVEEFKKLWDSIHKIREYGWSENPMVYAIEFKLFYVKD